MRRCMLSVNGSTIISGIIMNLISVTIIIVIIVILIILIIFNSMVNPSVLVSPQVLMKR